MARAYPCEGNELLGPLSTMLLGLALASCSTNPPATAPARVEERIAVAPATALQRPAARWLPAAWSDLPDWSGDRTREAWVALQRSCERAAPDLLRAWQVLCAQALRFTPADDAATRTWLEQRLVPYRVTALDPQASGEGLATGYFEPQIDASRVPRGAMRFALHAPPADLATRKPWYTRAQIDTLPAASK